MGQTDSSAKICALLGMMAKAICFRLFRNSPLLGIFQISTMGAKVRQRIGGTTGTRASLPLALKLPNPPPRNWVRQSSTRVGARLGLAEYARWSRVQSLQQGGIPPGRLLACWQEKPRHRFGPLSVFEWKPVESGQCQRSRHSVDDNMDHSDTHGCLCTVHVNDCSWGRVVLRSWSLQYYSAFQRAKIPECIVESKTTLHHREGED